MSIQQANFICAPTEASPIFMKKIYVENPCQSEIEIAGLGFFELYINGKKVSEKEIFQRFIIRSRIRFPTAYIIANTAFQTL